MPAVYTNREKYRLPFSRSPSPKVLATMAVPPVPNISPTVDRIIRNGMMRFRAAKGVFPAKLDTKNPSTTPYMDVNTIMPMDGSVNRMSRP